MGLDNPTRMSDYLRGDREIDKDKKRSRSMCPKSIRDFIDEYIIIEKAEENESDTRYKKSNS